jgi:class 3 adenylate cyclase
LEPRVPPPIFTASFEVTLGEGPPATVSYVMARLRNEDGGVVGSVIIYTSPLPATVLALVARGDAAMFGRMAELVEPERRVAAIMFADLEASGALSRRLPSASYFRFLSAITTAVDEEVANRLGLVGKHAGDGVTAFFLADQVGSESGAARAAIDAARAVSRVAYEVRQELATDGVQLESNDCRLNVGVHWGGSLYMGQIVTGGRLEVTALGDEVNECARIEQTATEGQLLASKPVIEHLSSHDAAALQIDPETLAYRTLADFASAGDKALRDAAAIPVTDLAAKGT